ncbi:hypothetical protein F5Y15DRAFT_399774 [Xylariaceae sp. FL0016]|nr:hypothetical protein F5Y15DRAFT_399774 [Xylariaceae sp. FL0016]
MFARASFLSLLSLAAWFGPSEQSPLAQRDVPGNSWNPTPLDLLGTRSYPKCNAPWMVKARGVADKVPKHGVATLCSSYLGKYTTTTKTVYTSTAHPTVTISQATTAKPATVTATVTVQVTEDVTEESTSTFVDQVTETATETVVAATETVTVTAGTPEKRGVSTCDQIKGLVHIQENQVREFCGCYAPGPKSTITVTKKLVATAKPVTATKITTIQPKPTTATATRVVAELIKGMTTEEMREIFDIMNDFTPEDEAKIQAEIAWAEDLARKSDGMEDSDFCVVVRDRIDTKQRLKQAIRGLFNRLSL